AISMDRWEHAELVEEALRKYLSDPEPKIVFPADPIDLRKLAAELNLLPAMLDMGGCYAVCPDGQIISFLWDSPYDLRAEHDPRIINIVLHQASKQYPDLAELKPKRPPGARVCSICKGTGDALFGMGLRKEYDNVVCYCGDLGWLPPEEKAS